MNQFAERHFTNGSVYGVHLHDELPVEITDTFLPYDTKFCINSTNKLKAYEVGSRNERWMVGVSCQSGCPVHCKFCATGQLKTWRNLTEDEIIDQVVFIVNKNRINPVSSKEFKINYTRMGEPFLNINNVKKAIKRISMVWPKTHHYISTIGIKNSDFSWIEGNTTLQISLHSLDEERRHDLIPFGQALMSLEELGKIRTKSNLKTTLNLTLVDVQDFDIDKLKRYFDPKHFFIKLSPINPSEISRKNGIFEGLIKYTNLL